LLRAQSEEATVSDVFVHPQGINESNQVGTATRIWAFAHVMKGAVVGDSCNVGEGAFIESGAVVGNHVTIKNGVAIWDRVIVEDYVFLGPCAVLTNDPIPRSHPDFRGTPDDWLPTRLCEGASIGANATIVCGHTLGPWCFVGAGAVVTRDVRSHALVAGNPARQIGWVCRCGHRLDEAFKCRSCQLAYAETPIGLEITR
jgi:acetyltransferase-like isoleucine patch superfamily enzyme